MDGDSVDRIGKLLVRGDAHRDCGHDHEDHRDYHEDQNDGRDSFRYHGCRLRER